ncbi:hypothetical protein NEUTE2DRAFT_161697 [Neurospora tetrasperma FGSC 2509]|nr:hypothetical protein NEUTE2DRAFT_161697 [Neurospora tetrasperma FGSC 2509]
MTLTIRRAVFGVFCSMAAQETILQLYSTHWPDNDMNAFPPEGWLVPSTTLPHPPAGTQPFNHQGLMLQHRIANIANTASREPARWTRSSSSPIVVSSIFTAAGIVDATDAISPSPSIALVATLIVKFLVWGDCALLAELNVAPDVIPPPTPWLLTLPTFMFLVLRGHATEGPTNPAASHDGLEQMFHPRYAGHIQSQRCGFNNSSQRLLPVPWPSDVPKQQQLSIDPTPLVIVLFFFFFVTFFGLTLLATSKHMHHAHKLGVLYVVGSVTRKWLDQAKALEQPTALRAQDSPSAPWTIGVPKSFVKTVNKATAQRDNKDQTINNLRFQAEAKSNSATQKATHEGDKEIQERGLECPIDHKLDSGAQDWNSRGAQQRLASYMKRLEEEQKKINDIRYARDESEQAGKDPLSSRATMPKHTKLPKRLGVLDRQRADIRLDIEMKRAKIGRGRVAG